MRILADFSICLILDFVTTLKIWAHSDNFYLIFFWGGTLWNPQKIMCILGSWGESKGPLLEKIKIKFVWMSSNFVKFQTDVENFSYISRGIHISQDSKNHGQGDVFLLFFNQKILPTCMRTPVKWKVLSSELGWRKNCAISNTSGKWTKELSFFFRPVCMSNINRLSWRFNTWKKIEIEQFLIKFVISNKATKIDDVFTVTLTLTT